jgi:hypothetical protein
MPVYPGALRVADNLSRNPGHPFPEARFWIASGLTTTREQSKVITCIFGQARALECTYSASYTSQMQLLTRMP